MGERNLKPRSALFSALKKMQTSVSQNGLGQTWYKLGHVSHETLVGWEHDVGTTKLRSICPGGTPTSRIERRTPWYTHLIIPCYLVNLQ